MLFKMSLEHHTIKDGCLHSLQFSVYVYFVFINLYISTNVDFGQDVRSVRKGKCSHI